MSGFAHIDVLFVSTNNHVFVGWRVCANVHMYMHKNLMSNRSQLNY